METKTSVKASEKQVKAFLALSFKAKKAWPSKLETMGFQQLSIGDASVVIKDLISLQPKVV